VPVRHAVDCYRMEYSAVDARGETLRLSGLLALPHGIAPRRLTSFQHGTTTARTAVPSKPDGTGLAAAILFAGNGYALVAPDYPGLGVSPGRRPYYVADPVGASVVGMIDAARKVKGVPDNAVFLSGFSEGGWATLVALQQLEAQGKPVLGAARSPDPTIPGPCQCRQR
jgi:pimeloyl-ACP methyl ester carboxylesterase